MKARAADLERDRSLLLDQLRAGLPEHSGENHFRWRYLDNPDGVARAWLLEQGDEIIGAAAAFPRRFRVAGRDVLAWNLGDFCIRQDRRSLGPAVALQRAIVSPVLEGEVPFAYDHPSCNMMAVYRWLKIERTAEVVRFAKLLGVDEHVERLVRAGWLSRVASGIGNVVLRVADRGLAVRRRHETGRLRDRFDARVLELQAEIEAHAGIVGVRSPEYLNWRYLDHPMFSFRSMAVERDERLLGYIVYRVDGRQAVVAEFVVGGDRAVADALLAGVVDELRAEGVLSLSAPTLAGSPISSHLRTWGFVARESAPFVVTCRAGEDPGARADRPEQWFHSDGDRDV